MRHSLNSILYMGVVTALISLAPAYCQPQPAAPQATPQQPGEPKLGNRKPAPTGSAPVSVRPSPAAQYSPLAAQGGYRGHGMTWYDALFHSLNPKNIDWGMSWEQRRSMFLQNSIGNKYFIYTAALSLLLVYSVVVITWQRWSHGERLKQLAQRTADAMNYANYWKDRAGEAIRKHNAHIERCNRVIEVGETGMPPGGVAEAADWRTEMERMRTELSNAQSDNKRLEAELEQKKAMVADMSARVDEATQKIGNASGRGNGSEAALKADDKVALVDRINRLETALAAAKDENRRLKGA
ncbi:MAG: hypothetical protein ACRD7E_17870 [Bryobacteraceae bacterium]